MGWRVAGGLWWRGGAKTTPRMAVAVWLLSGIEEGAVGTSRDLSRVLLVRKDWPMRMP